MRVIVGYGNELRGEDAFGIDVVEELEKYELKDTKFITTFQLTPEMVLELLEASEIIFIDACYSLNDQYSLACSIMEQNSSNLTHQISPKIIISMLNNLYDKYPKYQIYSMLTDNFDKIVDKKRYKDAVQKSSHYIMTTQ